MTNKRVCELCKFFGISNRDAKHLDVVLQHKIHRHMPVEMCSKMDLCNMHYMINKHNIKVEQNSKEGGEKT